jgi:hypothetical protein
MKASLMFAKQHSTTVNRLAHQDESSDQGHDGFLEQRVVLLEWQERS